MPAGKYLFHLLGGHLGLSVDVANDAYKNQILEIHVKVNDDLEEKIYSLVEPCIGQSIESIEVVVEKLGRCTVMDLSQMHMEFVDKEGIRSPFPRE